MVTTSAGVGFEMRLRDALEDAGYRNVTLEFKRDSVHEHFCHVQLLALNPSYDGTLHYAYLRPLGEGDPRIEDAEIRFIVLYLDTEIRIQALS